LSAALASAASRKISSRSGGRFGIPDLPSDYGREGLDLGMGDRLRKLADPLTGGERVDCADRCRLLGGRAAPPDDQFRNTLEVRSLLSLLRTIEDDQIRHSVTLRRLETPSRPPRIGYAVPVPGGAARMSRALRLIA
jgi:hypothetical protein